MKRQVERSDSSRDNERRLRACTNESGSVSHRDEPCLTIAGPDGHTAARFQDWNEQDDRRFLLQRRGTPHHLVAPRQLSAPTRTTKFRPGLEGHKERGGQSGSRKAPDVPERLALYFKNPERRCVRLRNER